MRRTATLGIACGAVLVVSCGGSADYDLTLVLTGGDQSMAASVQLDVVRDGCDRMPRSGFPPHESEVVRPFTWPFGEEAPVVGNLDPGSYGFYARIRSPVCQVHWVGCAAKKIQEDGTGLIEVVLEPVDGPVCDPGTRCNGEGVCVEIDAGL